MSASKGFSFDCECGKCKMATLDGYPFGDTLLEGVLFEVIIKNGEMTIRVGDDDVDYMSDLNAKKWLKEAALDAVQSDVLCCSSCGGDVAVMYDGVSGYEQDGGMLAKLVKIDADNLKKKRR